MEKENQIEKDQYEENDIKVNRIGKISVTDILLMIGGVLTIGIVTMLLSWMIM